VIEARLLVRRRSKANDRDGGERGSPQTKGLYLRKNHVAGRDKCGLTGARKKREKKTRSVPLNPKLEKSHRDLSQRKQSITLRPSYPQRKKLYIEDEGKEDIGFALEGGEASSGPLLLYRAAEKKNGVTFDLEKGDCRFKGQMFYVNYCGAERLEVREGGVEFRGRGLH